MQMRAFFEVASELAYIHLRRIRIWKCSIGDEGVRYLCKYLCSSYSLNLIDLLDNGITALGCEFIGKAVQSPACRVLHLKLDNNLILSEGLKFLAVGLRQNHVLDKLSLKYCGINGQGAMYVQ
jgi:Ran GTPase-activating protein (RanGAP) involved in mRNA processing and transport